MEVKFIDLLVLDWNILITILSTFSMAIYFKFFMKPKIERRYERNEFNVLLGTMGFVNSFDEVFVLFYEFFEREIRPIRELHIDQWKPGLYGPGDVRINAIENTHPEIDEYTHSEIKMIRNIVTYRDKFNKYLEEMGRERKRIIDYMYKNESYLDPVLRENINQYTLWTYVYVEQLLQGWNTRNLLQKRSHYAFQIIKVLKNEQDFQNKIKLLLHISTDMNKSFIGTFIEKWGKYGSFKHPKA